MKRLIKAIRDTYEINEVVRFVDTTKTGYFTVLAVDNQNNTYTLIDPNNEIINNIAFDDIIGENEFLVGDKVRYEKHPYNNNAIYEVKSILSDGTYFISNGDQSYTNISGRSIKLVDN